tara:strand:+ start:92 stop:334 length:243 start_codon:yes stop_codon:yes gene_type:complete
MAVAANIENITTGSIGNSPKLLIFTVINKAIIRQKPLPNSKSHVRASTTGKFLHYMLTIPKVIPTAPRIIYILFNSDLSY